jgi:two-component system chemotaxis sensor kinase CheA
MSGNSIRDTFFEECEELLEALVEGLAEMEASTEDMEIINAVFRSVHSIKGGAGAFGLDRLVNFAHTFETVMDMVRDRALNVDEKLMSLFHRSGDMLSDIVASERDSTNLAAGAESAVVNELESYLGDKTAEEDFAFDALTLDFDAAPIAVDENGTTAENPAEVGLRKYHISFQPQKALYENGHEPLLLLDALAELGELKVEADLSALPEFDSFDPNDAIIRWQMELVSSETETTLQEVFEFVEGLCTLEISVDQDAPPPSPPPTPTESGPAQDPAPGATAPGGGGAAGGGAGAAPGAPARGGGGGPPPRAPPPPPPATASCPVGPLNVALVRCC